ncbi:MAG TPA: DapH/DapD/GlmU-related protein [Solirubrobacteraceae bacterium]|jgi:serine O-acetyltransferase
MPAEGATNPQAAPRQGMGAVRGALRGSDFILSARRLWVISSKLHHAGHPRLARVLKNLNSMLYHNSLPPEVQLSPDVRLGHHGVGTVLHPKIVIGERVKIFQNVTMAVRPPNAPQQIVIEDGVVVGANAVIMTPRNRSIRIGEGARVGAGAVVTKDVPARMIAISPPVELRPRGGFGADADSDHSDDDDGEDG